MVVTGSEIVEFVDARLAELGSKLREVNRTIHSNPELLFEEHIAHDTICDFLESLGYKVTRHAYGLETSFEVIYGQGGRMININCEYDALPDGGHMCGHNLIATSSIAAFLGLVAALEKTKVAGRVQLLGTPAEEGGGGKALLINAGAYKDVSASLMAHPGGNEKEYQAYANTRPVAAAHVTYEYKGKPAHAGAYPWDGINALDAFVSLYNNVSLLRQQVKPDERLHCCLVEGPKVANLIPEHTKVDFTVRSNTLRSLEKLVERVDNCANAAALATGCTMERSSMIPYADHICPQAMNDQFIKHLTSHGIKTGNNKTIQASTDQGNVSHVVPSLHAMFSLEEAGDSNPHQKPFEKAAGKDKAHNVSITIGKSLAQTAFDLIVDDSLYDQVHKDWKQDIDDRKDL